MLVAGGERKKLEQRWDSPLPPPQKKFKIWVLFRDGSTRRRRTAFSAPHTGTTEPWTMAGRVRRRPVEHDAPAVQLRPCMLRNEGGFQRVRRVRLFSFGVVGARHAVSAPS